MFTSWNTPTCFYQKYVEMTRHYKVTKIYIHTIQILTSLLTKIMLLQIYYNIYKYKIIIYQKLGYYIFV